MTVKITVRPNLSTLTLLTLCSDVRLTPENQVTVDARQDLPGGAELEPVDKSILGQEIKIEKVSNSKK